MLPSSQDAKQKLLQEVLDKLGVEILIKNKVDKPLEKEIVDYIWHVFLVGIFVNEAGGIKK